MNRPNHSAAASVPSPASAPDLRVILDAVVRSSRPLLVQIARVHLGSRRALVEDVVQDACLAVLEGQVRLSSDPKTALLDLLRAVAALARQPACRARRPRKRP